MTVTDRQLKTRARQLQAAETKRYHAMTLRDALIIQAVQEGRTKSDIAALVGLTKARVGKIVDEGIGADRYSREQGAHQHVHDRPGDRRSRQRSRE
jgi:hypothetical protein